MKHVNLLLFCLLVSIQLVAQPGKIAISKPINLFDNQLSYWYKWIGVPRTNVTGLPPGTHTDNGFNGTPLGRNDPKNVFSVKTLEGEQVLAVSGEIYGGLTTKKEYENYHLHLQYKWGTKKYAPRLTQPRDMGIMFHCTGTNEDALFNAFLMGLECQICENTSGDLFLGVNKTFSILPLAEARVGEGRKWDVNATLRPAGAKNGNLGRSKNYESDSTKWTTMDVYTVGGAAVYLVNGHVVMALQNAAVQRADGTIVSLTKGKIQLQSEAAEAYYKDISIQAISDIPDAIKKAAGFDLKGAWKLADVSKYPPVAKPSTPVDPSRFEEYTGSYKMGNMIIKITHNSTDLLIQLSEDFPQIKLDFKKADEFGLLFNDARYIFERKDGVVTQLKMINEGKESVATKEPVK